MTTATTTSPAALSPEELFEQHAEHVVRTVTPRILRSAPRAVDRDAVEQAARVGAWQAARHYDPARGVPFVPYACLVAGRHAAEAARLSAPRTYGRLPNAADADVALDDEPGRDPAPWHNLVAQDALSHALGGLPLPSQVIARCLWAEGLTPEEVAEVFDLPRHQIYRLVREKIRPHVAERLGRQDLLA